jgi:ATP-binding cassette subfamily B protein IrtB
MFKTVKRIIDWCGEFKGRLYAGFVVSFFSHLFTALPIMLAAYTIGLLLQSAMDGTPFDTGWVWKSLILLLVLVFLRFLFDYLRTRFQEAISYELVARDRLAVGDALKRVSLGYFQQVSTGNILNSLTTGLGTLEGMGIRMIDNFVGGYLNFAVVFLSLLVFSPRTAVIALAAAAVSLVFLLAISHYSAQNAPVEAQANRDMTGAILEYARGLAVVKSFGKDAAALDTIRQSIADSKNIHLKIEWGYLPSNALHLLALKCGSVGLTLSACLSGLNGQMELPVVLTFVFFSFSIFASLEPISGSAHVLSVIDDAMDQLDKLWENHFIDSDGKDIPLQHFDIAFDHVDFGYDSRQVLHDVSLTIPDKTTTAIVGPSGSGKSTLCSLMAHFWDVDSGSVKIGGVDVRDYTLESLMDQISMVFQNVYLFTDTIENNIKFGCPDATHEQVVEAARKACCDDFIEALPDGYNTVIGEGGAHLSGGEKQRISIARAMLKDAPIVILDEATANVDPENEDRLQKAIEALTRDKTIIMIAHRLKTVRHADQILVVDHGRIVQQGTHEQLIGQPGIYAAFVGGRKQAEGWKL